MFPYRFQVQMVSHVHSIDLIERQATMIVGRPSGAHEHIEIPSQQTSSFVLEYHRPLPDSASNYGEVSYGQSCRLDLCFESHRKRKRVTHRVSLCSVKYWSCRLKMHRWTTKTTTTTHKGAPMGVELRLLSSLMQYRRTTAYNMQGNQIETTYRNVWIRGLAVPLGVDLHEEDSFSSERRWSCAYFQVAFWPSLENKFETSTCVFTVPVHNRNDHLPSRSV